MSLLTVSNVSEVKSDKNGKDYKVVEFSTPNTKDVNGLKVRVQPKTSSKTFWEESYLDNKMQFGYDFIKGDLVEGNVVTREVAEYEIQVSNEEVRQVTSYTAVVFGDTFDPSFEIEIQKAFKAAGHEISEVKTKQTSIPVASSTVKDEVYV